MYLPNLSQRFQILSSEWSQFFHILSLNFLPLHFRKFLTFPYAPHNRKKYYHAPLILLGTLPISKSITNKQYFTYRKHEITFETILERHRKSGEDSSSGRRSFVIFYLAKQRFFIIFSPGWRFFVFSPSGRRIFVVFSIHFFGSLVQTGWSKQSKILEGVKKTKLFLIFIFSF